ncbi:MAG: hypothetical protein A3J24_07425 [Deltaproteobacteria bacterium RIFCSPLOWO2_02_FULL_53_8]|nr:MAG: hypothetical protein A3J24_07425 [Deltaproteobacteria bacterium RIFCSPLOWO2_02_FULL_53_8]
MEIESIKKIYGGYANAYEALFKRFFYPRIKSAITSMEIKPGDLILDVGVGTGLSFLVFPKHCNIIGIDLSPEMLKHARDKIQENDLHNIKLLSMDAMCTAFKDNTFDTVFISHVVSVVPDPYKLMEEVKRVCRKDGQVVIVNHFKSRNKIVEAVEKIINPVCKRIGWRSDMCLNEFVSRTGLRVEKKYMLKKLDFWHILFAKNVK